MWRGKKLDLHKSASSRPGKVLDIFIVILLNLQTVACKVAIKFKYAILHTGSFRPG